MAVRFDAGEERVVLPGGLVGDAGDGCLTTAVLRPLTGAEEEWLASHPDAPSAVAVTHLLSHCLLGLGERTPDRDLVRRLLVGDRDFLMLQLRRLTLGDQLQAVVSCPACTAPMDVDFRLGDVPVQPRPQRRASYTIEVSDGPQPRTIHFRLPTGADQEEVLDAELEDAAAALLARCVLDPGDGVLSEAEMMAVEAAMETQAPGIDLELDVSCPECGAASVIPFDLTRFFLDELALQTTTFLREVHYLALHYHWSLAEILGLTRSRRRAFLSLLADQLRPS
jgi:hypothetical protein